MLRNFFKSNLRALWKNRSHTLINIIGLALGISSAIIIFLVVRFELSFDTYHPHADRIYRVVEQRTRLGEVGYNTAITYPLPDAMRQDFPGIEYITITDGNEGDPVMGIPQTDGGMERFKEKQVIFVDPDYFQMFHYDWIEGNPSSALTDEKTVVITQSVATKYFGSDPAINKIINYNNSFDLRVSGVVSDPPQNTDLPFRILISTKLGADKHAWEDWGASSRAVNAFVELKPGVNAVDFQSKMKGWHLKYFTGGNKEEGELKTYFLQPLSEMHYDSRFGNYNHRVISMQTIMALTLIGILLLITACINFVNLNTVLIEYRAKEVGVRKVLGSNRLTLILQFLGETFFITVLALLISMGLIELVLINLNDILGYRITFQPLSDVVTMLVVLILPFGVTLISGLYPSFSLASFQPIKALRNKSISRMNDGVGMRRMLISVQLMISQALVICTIIVIQQMNYFMNRPLGLDSSSIVEFELPNNNSEDLKLLKERLQTIPGVENVNMNNTGSISPIAWGGDMEAVVGGEKLTRDCKIKFVDADYVKTFHLQLLAGEDLIKSDTANRYLVNEAMVKSLGLSSPEEAIGIPITFWDRKALISGVVKDFNTSSLHHEILPILITTSANAYQNCSVRLQTHNLKEAMADIEATWEHTFPKYVFEYSFLEDTIQNFYVNERRISRLMSIFSGVAVLIGCIGLFGLISFMVARKTKEVGIRKTLGANVSNIMFLFSKEFLILIFISFAFAAPLAWYFMHQWLDNFAYRIEPGWTTFAMGIGLSMIIVLGTVSYKTYRAAIANPVDALKDE